MKNGIHSKYPKNEVSMHWCRGNGMEDNTEVRTCKKYKYLRITLNREGTDEQEINNRITKVRRIIAYRNGILWNKSIMKKKEVQRLRNKVKSVMLYECETWRLIERREH
jgi:hypothetical protein